jgi:predicted kinase
LTLRKKKMPKLYVLVGIPGSGKSTWVKNQDWAKDCSYISTDMWVDMEAERQGKTYSEVFKDYMPHAVKLMANQVELARDLGRDIIWDQTSTTIASRERKFNMLPDYYAIAVVFKTPEKDELDRRLASRIGKHIPSRVIRSMIAGWDDPTEDEGFKEIWNAC